jgi:hypothetical protein
MQDLTVTYIILVIYFIVIPVLYQSRVTCMHEFNYAIVLRTLLYLRYQQYRGLRLLKRPYRGLRLLKRPYRGLRLLKRPYRGLRLPKRPYRGLRLLKKPYRLIGLRKIWSKNLVGKGRKIWSEKRKL